MRLSLTAQVAVSTAVGGFVAGLFALGVGSTTLSVGTGVIVRTVLVVLVLVLAPAIAVRRHVLDVDRTILRRSAAIGVVLGYLLNPLAWLGRAVAAQTVVPAGPASAAVDLILWVGVGVGAVAVASRSATHREPLGYETPA